MEPKGTQSYIHKADAQEITVRAKRLGKNVAKTSLFHLLAVIPFAELKELYDKYLGTKQKAPRGE